jgi:hypothetical protein
MAQKRRLPTTKGTLPSVLLQGYITRPAGDRQPSGLASAGAEDPQRGPEAYKEDNKEG